MMATQEKLDKTGKEIRKLQKQGVDLLELARHEAKEELWELAKSKSPEARRKIAGLESEISMLDELRNMAAASRLRDRAEGRQYPRSLD